MATRALMAIARQSYFTERVLFYLEKAAIAVMAEAANTTGHALRVAFAEKILAGIDPTPFAIGVMTNATISGEADAATPPDFAIPDGDIEFVVNTLFNSFAGVSL